MFMSADTWGIFFNHRHWNPLFASFSKAFISKLFQLPLNMETSAKQLWEPVPSPGNHTDQIEELVQDPQGWRQWSCPQMKSRDSCLTLRGFLPGTSWPSRNTSHPYPWRPFHLGANMHKPTPSIHPYTHCPSSSQNSACQSNISIPAGQHLVWHRAI